MKKAHRAGKITFLLLASELIAGCGGGHAKPTQDTYSAQIRRLGETRVAVVQCLVDQQLVPQKDLAGQTWIKNGDIVDPYGQEFYHWYSRHALNRYGGQSLEQWVGAARDVDPRSACRALIPGVKKRGQGR